MHINDTIGAERDARQASVGVDAPDIHHYRLYSAPIYLDKLSAAALPRSLCIPILQEITSCINPY
jgi:hypothetical protein